MAQKLISQGTLKSDSEINNGPILALKVSKEAYWMCLLHSVRLITKMIVF